MKLAENPFCNPLCQVCHYKGDPYSIQLLRKDAWACKQFGRWKGALQAIRPAPLGERLHYRSKSWLQSSHRDGLLSFGMYRSVRVAGRWGKEFISWDTCPLHLEGIRKVVENLRRELPLAVGELDSLVGVWMGAPHCVLVFRDADRSVLKSMNWERVLVHPFDRVWFHSNSQVGRKVFGHRPIELVFGEPSNGIHPIRAFRQVAQSLLVEARMRAVEKINALEPAWVVDLYCGTGDLSLLLSPEMGWLGIELSQEAARFAAGLRPDSSRHFSFVGSVEHRLRDPQVMRRIQQPYVLYVNPPRPGIGSSAWEPLVTLLREKPPLAVIYLSCSASSLARDLMVFEKEGFSVDSLQPYDFFPQTEHFETLAILRKLAPNSSEFLA
jgi:23S rRNA (uracil1939-C5)-methyltransferase